MRSKERQNSLFKYEEIRPPEVDGDPNGKI